jgi:hypothetical protein
LRRCSDGEWLGQNLAERLDPDILRERLGEILFHTEAWSDVLWDKGEYDIREIARLRRRQKMFLARYAAQDLRSWDDCDVTEIATFVETLNEMLSEESATAADAHATMGRR